jgi:RNA polymerase sigma-70 factor, ECF subfamily
MALMAGVATVGDLVSAIGVRAEESAIIAELKAGSEDAYAWLIGAFHRPHLQPDLPHGHRSLRRR